jgi:hypothetical protein
MQCYLSTYGIKDNFEKLFVPQQSVPSGLCKLVKQTTKLIKIGESINTLFAADYDNNV